MSSFYKSGKDRKQQLLFPPSLDEYISEDSSVRAIDEYVKIIRFLKFRLSRHQKKLKIRWTKGVFSKTITQNLYLWLSQQN